MSAEGGVKISSLGGVTSTKGTSVTGGHVNVMESNMLCTCIYFQFCFHTFLFLCSACIRGVLIPGVTLYLVRDTR